MLIRKLKKVVRLLRHLDSVPSIAERLSQMERHIESLATEVATLVSRQAFGHGPDEAEPRRLALVPRMTAERFWWMEAASIPQSMVFMADILPVLNKLVRNRYPYGQQVSVLDVGTSTGAGAQLLARLHRDRFFGAQLSVTALDISDEFQRYARAMFPDIEYRVGDIYQIKEQWDIVTCSHCIEHVPEPGRFAARLCELARDFVLLYAPYNELQLLEGHPNRIDDQFLDSLAALNPIETTFRDSIGWRHPHDAESRCVLVVLPGTAAANHNGAVCELRAA